MINWGNNNETGEFTNEINTEQPRVEQPQIEDIWSSDELNDFDTDDSQIYEEYNPTQLTEQKVETKQKTKTQMKVKPMYFVGIVVIIILFIIISIVTKPKTLPVQEGGCIQEPLPVEDNFDKYSYENYKIIIGSSVSEEYGFDYSMETYYTETGEQLGFNDLLTNTGDLNQASYVSLTKDARRNILRDILDISTILKSSGKFDITFDTKLAIEISELSFIDNTMYAGVLYESGRSSLSEKLEEQDNPYKADVKMIPTEVTCYDKNGSKVTLVNGEGDVDSNGTMIIIIRITEAGNVEEIPAFIDNKPYMFIRDAKYDEINNGFITGYGYSLEIEGLNVGEQYFLMLNCIKNEDGTYIKDMAGTLGYLDGNTDYLSVQTDNATATDATSEETNTEVITETTDTNNEDTTEIDTDNTEVLE